MAKNTLQTGGEDEFLTVCFDTVFIFDVVFCTQFTVLIHSFRVQFYIFSTLFECSFTSSPLFSSVVLHLLHSFPVQFYIFSTLFECSFTSFPLVLSVVLHLHSFRVQLTVPMPFSPILRAFRTSNNEVSQVSIKNYTRNEWRRCRIHSKRVEKMYNTLETSREDVEYTRSEWRRCRIHSKRVKKIQNYTRKDVLFLGF